MKISRALAWTILAATPSIAQAEVRECPTFPDDLYSMPFSVGSFCTRSPETS